MTQERERIEASTVVAAEVAEDLRILSRKFRSLALDHGVDPASYIEAARATAHDELEVDDEPMVSPGENGEGCWVSSWVWVSKEDL